MNKSQFIDNENPDAAPEGEVQIRSALNYETNFARRQDLLKSLWRLRQSSQSRKDSDPNAKAGNQAVSAK